MVSEATFRKLALAFEEAAEQPHFEKPSFRVGGKIFATLEVAAQRAVLKLSAIDQSVFCTFDMAVIHPVSGAWGKSGWTVVELKNIPQEMLQDVLTCAYCGVAPQRLAAKYKQA